MTALDIMVLLSLGVGAVLGGLRGFTSEVFSLAAWIAGIAAVKLLYTPVAAALETPVGSASGAAALAVALCFGLAFVVTRVAGTRLGAAARQSVLGPVDRVLGFGFGLLKGLLVATAAFLFMSLIYDTIYGVKAARPEWMTASRTYTLLRASSAALVDAVEAGRGQP